MSDQVFTQRNEKNSFDLVTDMKSLQSELYNRFNLKCWVKKVASHDEATFIATFHFNWFVEKPVGARNEARFDWSFIVKVYAQFLNHRTLI